MRNGETLIKDVSRHRLDNGLTVLARQDRSVPVVTSMMWYKVGSRHESPGMRGVSHLLEHLMFKGTDRYGKGEIDYITTRLGGSNNAFTSLDSTAYYFCFASDRWLTALDIEASRMGGNLFEPREFEMERKVVIEELKMDLDQPWSALRSQVERKSFRSHPYRYPVIGLLQDLRSISLEQVRDYYLRRYSPANAVLVLVGDFEPAEALRQVRARFESLPDGGREAETACPEEPPRQAALRVDVRRTARVSRLLLAFPAPSIRNPDHYVMQVIDRLLSEGKLCRLYQSLVEEQRLASMASTEVTETYDPYLLLARFELRNGISLQEAEERILAEFSRLGQEAPAEDDVARARKQCCTQVLQEFETTLDQAVQLGMMETLVGFEYWVDYLRRIRSVTPEDVRRVAERYLDPSQVIVGRMPRTRSQVA
ncbi:MAG TPA: pitrilysin family protein [Acidobacteriota bacterium]|nr:pitrilysin family protein [Acidobacteriota bacterium]